MSKWTPGPWEIGFGGHDNDDYATITSPHSIYIYQIAELGGPGYRLANARLIAAAPELLAACKEAYSLVKNSPWWGEWL